MYVLLERRMRKQDYWFSHVQFISSVNIPVSSRYKNDELAASISPSHGKVSGLVPGMRYQTKVTVKIKLHNT
jgi:hypothetical protein